MGLEGAGFQLGMELHADEPGVARNLDDFRKKPVRRKAGETKAGGFELVAITRIDLIAMTMPFRRRSAGTLERGAMKIRRSVLAGVAPWRAFRREPGQVRRRA